MRRILSPLFGLLLGLATAEIYANRLWTLDDRSTPRTSAARAGDVFNIMDYGAVCDGTTNDNAAINATFAAAYASVAYSSNNMVTVEGPTGRSSACLMNSVNLTMFNKGTGANSRARLTVRDMTLLCTGAGNVCFDLLGATLVKMTNVNVRGDGTSAATVPEICIQVGQINDTVSSAWHNFTTVNCNNAFGLAALYNVGSEANTYLDSMFLNAQGVVGPIGTLGAITGGSGYTNGTFTNVPLTGGGGSGALATIVVAGGAVTSVTVTYQGRRYLPAATLGAASLAAGTGFSVPVAAIAPMAVALDGQNYWRAASAFQTVVLAQNHWNSMTLIQFIGGSIRQFSTGPALWSAWISGASMLNTYILNSAGGSCVTLFDNGITKGGIVGPNAGWHFNTNCEGNTRSFFHLTGSNANPLLLDYKLRVTSVSLVSMFSTDPHIASVRLENADYSGSYAPATQRMFESAKLWTVSGRFALPYVAHWNAPASFKGELVLRTLATPPKIGPLDILGDAAVAASCARQLSASYVGPLCRVQRTSDSTLMDLYADVRGDLDKPTTRSFCYATICKVAIVYDQSGNTNDFVQTNVALQPVLNLSYATLGNRPALQFIDSGAIAMAAPADPTIDNLWDTAGYMSIAATHDITSTNPNRLLYKTNTGTYGWDYRANAGGTSYTFQKIATGVGTWGTPGLPAGAHVLDVQYSADSVANLPNVGVDGTPPTLTSAQPTGTFTTDAASPLILGNNSNTTGNRGFPGHVGEVVLWKATPTALQLEAIRRNQAAFYNIGNVN